MGSERPSITLIRHGETTWSASGRHTGRSDLALTERGERQARDLRPLFSEAAFDVVAVSPSQRARRTAELVGLGAPVVLDDLREWDYGDLEGLTTAEIRTRLPDWTIWRGPWPGGELPAQVAQRADSVIAWALDLPPKTRLVLVAHGHILRVLAARWLQEAVSSGRMWALDTASVSELGWEHDEPVLRRWNLTPGPWPE